jgi:hypothetical protein
MMAYEWTPRVSPSSALLSMWSFGKAQAQSEQALSGYIYIYIRGRWRLSLCSQISIRGQLLYYVLPCQQQTLNVDDTWGPENESMTWPYFNDEADLANISEV